MLVLITYLNMKNDNVMVKNNFHEKYNIVESGIMSLYFVQIIFVVECIENVQC